jgi:hypothetical protein
VIRLTSRQRTSSCPLGYAAAGLPRGGAAGGHTGSDHIPMAGARRCATDDGRDCACLSDCPCRHLFRLPALELCIHRQRDGDETYSDPGNAVDHRPGRPGRNLRGCRDHDERRPNDARNRRDVANEIELVVERSVDSAGRSHRDERVTIRRRTDDHFGSEIGAGTGPVLDDELPALISLLSLSTTSAGVFWGAPMPTKPLAS